MIKILTSKMYLALGWLFLGIGIFVPLIPVLPFILLSLRFFSKSSPEMMHWLTSHRRFGPMIRNWSEHGIVSQKMKAAMLISAILSISVGTYITESIAIRGFVVTVNTIVALCLLTRPSQKP